MKEIKKIPYYVTHLTLLAVLLIAGFVSVGGRLLDKSHICEYGEWETVKPATQTEEGQLARHCLLDETHVQYQVIEKIENGASQNGK